MIDLKRIPAKTFSPLHVGGGACDGILKFSLAHFPKVGVGVSELKQEHLKISILSRKGEKNFKLLSILYDGFHTAKAVIMSLVLHFHLVTLFKNLF